MKNLNNLKAFLSKDNVLKNKEDDNKKYNQKIGYNCVNKRKEKLENELISMIKSLDRLEMLCVQKYEFFKMLKDPNYIINEIMREYNNNSVKISCIIILQLFILKKILIEFIRK